MRKLSRQRIVWIAGSAVLQAALTAAPAVSHAGPPEVGFDVSYTVPCRDVTPEDFARASPSRKVIEASLQVSALFRQGDEKDVKELMYVIWSPEKRLQVAGFEPTTQVGSDVADSVEVVETDENATLLDGSVRVQLNPLAGVQVSPTAGASKTNKRNLQQKYSKLPSKQLLVASGTLNRGHGVFFKLKPSSQASLEGQREFVLQLVVPKGWRGDYVHVDCSAKVWDRAPWVTLKDGGSRQAIVGLYLQGDSEAREAANRLVRAYEAYSGLEGPTTRTALKPAGEAESLWRRVPGSSFFGAMIDELGLEDHEASKKKTEARKSFLAALEDLARLTG